ncbi:MAG: DNA-binding protein [Bacteroidetes bacterium]|nr:DNA-binding protein [Bacteroidota bacterium]
MRTKNDYTINFTGLSFGKHEFEYNVNKFLFEQYEDEDIVDSNIPLKITLDKEERMLSFNFVFKGVLSVLCDRCLEKLDLKVEGENNLYVKFGEEFLEEDDDIIVIPNKEHKIDLSHYIYEYILLQKPMQCVHKKGGCNKDMVDRISEINSDTNNEESVDPRWEALKTIKFE